MADEKKRITLGELLGQCLILLVVAVGMRVVIAVLSQPPVPPSSAHRAPKDGPRSFLDYSKDSGSEHGR